ncbi:phage tail family protein [Virgibacillus sp. AGTR]|uniref:phage tail family protein n=1 Tax=Virgibacillus sp. AGTR TaxID=2812055 RepID=UPI001965F287|nr:phage tail family protein [Virgibacillus sp. AGTR]MCC2250490.1 phage tail family protein [Virgibacillus sp. AGTR]QRZ18286.1 phage tail family protein [Virgibacillus sp. AGTR]
MRRLTFENSRGEAIIFYLSPLVIESLTGIGEIDADLQSEKAPYQDGDTHIDTLLQPRFIDLEGTITRREPEEIKSFRKQILRVCNPKLGLGKITLELDGDTKEIFGVLDGGPVFPERGRNVWQPFMITWKCPNPYWRETVTKSSQMSFVMGGFSFPLRLGTKFSQRSFRRIFKNDGDVETPVHIEFRGPAINPIIKNNTTGEFIQVNRTLSETDKLIIDTTFGQKSVEIEDAAGNRTDAFNWINPESWFFQLQIGENQLEYNSNNDSTKTRVVISYRNMYVGV